MSFEAKRPKTRILTTVVVLLTLVGAVPLVLFGQGLYSFNRERLEVQQQEHQLVIAEAISREIAEFARAQQARIRGLARGLEAAMALGSTSATLAAVGDAGLLNRYLEEDDKLLKLLFAVRSEDQADGLDLVVAEQVGQRERYAAAEERLVSRLLEQALNGKYVLEAPPEGEPILVAVAPVTQGDRVAGVLAALVSLEGLKSKLIRSSGELYLVYLTDPSASRILASSRRAIDESSVLRTELVGAFREGGGAQTMSFLESSADGDKAMLGAFATAADTGWGVFVQVDAETAYYAVQKMRRDTLVWTVISVLLALVFGSLFARRLVKPIRLLAEGALRLARGDFSQPIRFRSENELGLLADSFNHMGDEIRVQMQQLEVAASENKELFLGTVRMLAEAIDEKDPYTRGHSERVTRFSVAVARALEMTPDEVENVQIGALLHDVGKIGIDDRILRKPSMLTDAEFEIMKQHPEKGAHILGAVRQLGAVVPGMRFHHEKVDGTGYPLGLRENDIPIAAQIISVADTFDAMTTDRPYQKAMEPNFVIGKLHSWVGTRFRQDVVDAFERAFEAGEIISTTGIPASRRSDNAPEPAPGGKPT